MTEETLFITALEKGSKAERAAFLAEACAGDEALRRRVEALLESHEKTDFLRTSAAERAAIAIRGEATARMTEAAGGEAPEFPLGFLAPSIKPGSLGLLGHYEVLEVIGRGGMGVVLRAFDEKLHRVVAIKVMAAELATSATARRRFTREAQAAAAVSHDHIVTIHAVDEANGLPCLVMQYVAGTSLQERLDGRGPLPLHEILRIGMQAASGLAAAHAQGLIHRDIKPANLLLENGIERVKITDFGLARVVDDASLTQSGVVAGTPNYMAPEQARGEAVDQRADLFSLGSVLYAMCTGRAPFRASGTMAVLKRVCDDTPSPIREANPEVPEWLAAIIATLHAKDPAGRYQTAAEVAEVLGQHLARVQHPSVPTLPTTPARVSRSRRPWRWAKIAAVLACLVGGLGFAEATGVTQLATTVIRILTPDGTLVVEANDPAVSVTIEGDGGLLITGAGPQEVRLRPGSYQVHATKDGKPVRLDRDLVTITRSDRQVVKVRLEDRGDAVSAKVERGAFVVLGGPDVKERKFDTLAEAVLNAPDGETIEVRGSGPFVMDPVTITDQRALTIRAGNRCRPVLQLASGPVEDLRHLLSTNGPLVLEGLEIRCERRPTASGPVGYVGVEALGGLLHVANCRLVTPYRHCLLVTGSHRAIVKNCEILSRGWTDGLVGLNSRGAVWEFENSVQIGGSAIVFGDSPGRTVRVRRCSLVDCQIAVVCFKTTPRDPETGQLEELARFEVSENLLGGNCLMSGAVFPEFFEPSNPLLNSPAKEVFRRQVRWSGSRNAHHRLGGTSGSSEGSLIYWSSDDKTRHHPVVKDLAAWRTFWDSPESGSIEGIVRYQGADLAGRLATSGAQSIMTEDFRLRPGSAGYRAAPDGNDLGADVDLVGPGAAYERWKKTPEYQRWLGETRSLRSSEGRAR